MKKHFCTVLATLLAVSASAQLTLDQGSYASWQPIADTICRLDTTNVYPVFTPTTNAVWDVSGVTYKPTVRYFARNSATSTAFPTATFYDSSAYRINPSLAYAYMQLGRVTASGFEAMGQQVERQAFSLGAVTGGSTDSLVFLKQDIPYSATLTTISFPATMGSSWSSDYQFATNFSITVLMYGLNNAPCQRKTYVTRQDTVVGWGTMRVKDKLGVASAPMNVLMVKKIETRVDSFFLNGSPAPALMLSAFGLTQGQVIKVYQHKFLRAGELTPLLIADYKDSTFSSTKVNDMDIHIERLDYTTGINDLSTTGFVSAYPNPVVGNSLNIRIADRNVANLEYTVINMNGQIVSRGNLAFHDGASTITTDGFNASGIYYLQLYRANEQVAVLPLNIR